MKKTVITALFALISMVSINASFAAIGYVDYGKFQQITRLQKNTHLN